MKAKCPNEACPVELDYNDVPAYSAKKQIAGKFCPSCDHPLDPETAAKESLDYGPASAEVRSVRAAAAAKFVAACAGEDA